MIARRTFLRLLGIGAALPVVAETARRVGDVPAVEPKRAADLAATGSVYVPDAPYRHQWSIDETPNGIEFADADDLMPDEALAQMGGGETPCGLRLEVADPNGKLDDPATWRWADMASDGRYEYTMPDGSPPRFARYDAQTGEVTDQDGKVMPGIAEEAVKSYLRQRL